MIDKGILTNEEEKKLMDKEILNISQRSQKEVNENKTINKNPLVKEEEDNNNIIQVKAPEEAKKEITEEIIGKAGKLTIQVFIFLICQVKDGGKVPKETKIELNAAGYPDSIRKAFDGVTYFGTDKSAGLLV